MVNVYTIWGDTARNVLRFQASGICKGRDSLAEVYGRDFTRGRGVEVYERVGKSVISVCKKAQKN